mmetsp:Transcript_35415/g.40948  ORF Transcript_35415/g.40948 Transcript_35415/m.40948 type:complete len:200 (+) Transcript_35415:367-966(+)
MPITVQSMTIFSVMSVSWLLPHRLLIILLLFRFLKIFSTSSFWSSMAGELTLFSSFSSFSSFGSIRPADSGISISFGTFELLSAFALLSAEFRLVCSFPLDLNGACVSVLSLCPAEFKNSRFSGKASSLGPAQFGRNNRNGDMFTGVLWGRHELGREHLVSSALFELAMSIWSILKSKPSAGSNHPLLPNTHGWCLSQI